jgi:murein DD-endopeptidase MepM/ murein hydrolase activator NlpD
MVNSTASPTDTDPSFKAVDIAVTGSVAATTPTAIMDTTAKAKPKVKVKKEMTVAESEVQNQKRQAWRVAQQMRKAEAMNAALEEERRERLTIMDAWAQAQEAMKLRQLVGEGKTDAVDQAVSSSSVTSQALRPPMLPRSPTTPSAATPIPPQAHASSWFGEARSSSPKLPLMTVRVPIDLN